ncbi:hypothetical protein DITRI_Ditri11bG0055300 [Diplodiscus trichospermus]
MKNQPLLLFLICLSLFHTLWGSSQAELNRRTRDVDGLDDEDDKVHVGVILDMGSWEGKLIESSISMAVSDFYSLHKSYKVRVVLHVRDSQGDPFRALSATLNLLGDARVGAILGAQTSLEAKVLAEFGDRNKIPVISFSTPSCFPASNRSPFFVQVADDQASQVKGVAALIELYKWRNVILIHEDSDSDDLNNYDDTVSYMAAFFEEKNMHISVMSAIDASSEDDQIIEQLEELKTLQTKVFIVHLSHVLASRLFVNAKRLGMISKGYAWIVTSNSMNHLNLRDSSTIESMQGVIGFRSYIPASEELDNFTSRLTRKIYAEAPVAMQALQSKLLGSLAYDVAWSLTKAAKKAVTKVPCVSKLKSNMTDINIYGTSMYGSILLQEILGSNFRGLVGEFRFRNGKLISNAFEVVNVLHSGERRVGFCSSTGRITREIYESNSRRRRLFTNNLESIIWPGGSSTIPQGRMLQSRGKIHKIGVPVRKGFPQLVKVSRDPHTNDTTVSGFCIDVFQAAVDGLNYQVLYEFIPFMDANRNSGGTNYNDLIDQVYHQNFDAVVGDVTITANRSLYVDFTIPYTDIGVGIVAPTKSKDMWIFLKPLTPQLWLTMVGFHIITGFIIWLIERQSPSDGTEGLPQRHGFPLSMLVGYYFHDLKILTGANNISGEDLRNKWSIVIAVVFSFVVFILSSSYTATLASMMTVQHIKLNSKGSYIGYQAEAFFINNPRFGNHMTLKFHTAEEFADALSKGPKNGGVSAIIDEMPYIEIFLAQYPDDYFLIQSFSTTNGFAFVFPKGSPLATNISKEIAKLRESGKLDMLENAWFRNHTSLTSSGDNANNVRPLTLANFGGLFFISGILSVVAFLMFQIPLLSKYWQVVRNQIFMWRQIHPFMKFFKRVKTVQSVAIRPEVQIT